ncbi:MAG: hypothetical protein AAGM38_03275 [Pseudomonadota bacterium]
MNATASAAPRASSLFSFWRMALGLAAIALGMTLYALFFVDKLTARDDGSLEVRAQDAERWERQLPILLGFQKEVFDASRAEIEASISRHVDAAFAPVYDQVEPYSDFHYSIQGQYVELSSAVIGEFTETIWTRLYEAADFEANMARASEAIGADADAALTDAFAKLQARTQSAMGFSLSDMGLLTDVATLSQASALARFDVAYSAARVAGAVLGRQLTRRGMQAFTAQFARIMAAKLAARTAARSAGVGAGATTGAATGAIGGPIGSAVGGAVGALVGWFLTDAVAISIDEAINREAFEAQVVEMIDSQKEATKAGLLANYAELIAEITERNEQVFRDIKAKSPSEVLLRD